MAVELKHALAASMKHSIEYAAALVRDEIKYGEERRAWLCGEMDKLLTYLNKKKNEQLVDRLFNKLLLNKGKNVYEGVKIGRPNALDLRRR